MIDEEAIDIKGIINLVKETIINRSNIPILKTAYGKLSYSILKAINKKIEVSHLKVESI